VTASWEPWRAWPVLFAVVALGLALPAAPARAACGGVWHEAPAGRIDPAHRPPLAIGDSTMLLAVRSLARIGFEANARGCRQWDEGLALLARLRRQRRLAKVVLVHLGANAGVRPGEIRRALGILGPRRILVLVTPRPGRQARLVRDAGRRWPRRVRVLDWVRLHAGHYGWFSCDGLHLSDAGVRAFTRFCRPYLALARPRRVAVRVPGRFQPPRGWPRRAAPAA
jgi:hypothetical protein